MYHHINPHKGDTVTVTPGVFEGQMRFLRDSGYRTLTADELLSCISGNMTVPRKAVVVTFDDGWLDNYIYAFPVMKTYGIHAAIFVITDWTEGASEKGQGTPSSVPTHRESKRLIEKGEEHRVIMNWEMINEMALSGLIRFYSHTRSHRSCDLLTGQELSEELSGSKQAMEKHLAMPCPYLCWPYGKYSDMAVAFAKRVGYEALFTTHQGVAAPGSDPFFISRIVMKDNLAWFKNRIRLYTSPILSPLYLRIKAV